MNNAAALDSNALTYLLDAVADGYIPEDDPQAIRVERVAMFQLFCYFDRPLWVGPTAREEYVRITDPRKRERHDRWARYLLEDVEPAATESELRRRAQKLGHMAGHSDIDDCRIVAEAEAMGIGVLVTADRALASTMSTHAGLSILRPTQMIASLGLRPGTRPTRRPAEGNPLARQTWWRI